LTALSPIQNHDISTTGQNVRPACGLFCQGFDQNKSAELLHFSFVECITSSEAMNPQALHSTPTSVHTEHNKHVDMHSWPKKNSNLRYHCRKIADALHCWDKQTLLISSSEVWKVKPRLQGDSTLDRNYLWL